MKITDKKLKQENDQKVHQNIEVNFSKLNEHNNIRKRKNGEISNSFGILFKNN